MSSRSPWWSGALLAPATLRRGGAGTVPFPPLSFPRHITGGRAVVPVSTDAVVDDIRVRRELTHATDGPQLPRRGSYFFDQAEQNLPGLTFCDEFVERSLHELVEGGTERKGTRDFHGMVPSGSFGGHYRPPFLRITPDVPVSCSQQKA